MKKLLLFFFMVLAFKEMHSMLLSHRSNFQRFQAEYTEEGMQRYLFLVALQNPQWYKMFRASVREHSHTIKRLIVFYIQQKSENGDAHAYAILQLKTNFGDLSDLQELISCAESCKRIRIVLALLQHAYQYAEHYGFNGQDFLMRLLEKKSRQTARRSAVYSPRNPEQANYLKDILTDDVAARRYILAFESEPYEVVNVATESTSKAKVPEQRDRFLARLSGKLYDFEWQQIVGGHAPLDPHVLFGVHSLTHEVDENNDDDSTPKTQCHERPSAPLREYKECEENDAFGAEYMLQTPRPESASLLEGRRGHLPSYNASEEDLTA